MNTPLELPFEKLTRIKNNLEINLAQQKLVRLKFTKENLMKKLNHLETNAEENVFLLDPNESIVEL